MRAEFRHDSCVKCFVFFMKCSSSAGPPDSNIEMLAALTFMLTGASAAAAFSIPDTKNTIT